MICMLTFDLSSLTGNASQFQLTNAVQDSAKQTDTFFSVGFKNETIKLKKYKLKDATESIELAIADLKDDWVYDVNISIDEEKTTLPKKDYSITPSNFKLTSAKETTKIFISIIKQTTKPDIFTTHH